MRAALGQADVASTNAGNDLQFAAMGSKGGGPVTQVLTGDGDFVTDQVQRFADDNALAECRTNYQVVAIMGPQSSGKSTLLNHLFGTNFTMMDAEAGRGQTTKGIWLSKSPKIAETTTLIMDLEGSDGRERGEDDTNFERQSALFALAVADVLLVNIWCHDIGREQGSGKPLLKTIFQVNLKLFAPEPNRKRTVLLFVVRDKTKTPFNKLVEVLQADLDRMWDGIAKPPQYQGSNMQDFFEVQFAALSHFEERYEDFIADTVVLRRRFTPDAEDTLIRGDEKLPGDTFALSIKNIWDVIKSQKDLNLPAHKVMVANIRCQQILEDQLRAFTGDQAWAKLQEEAAACAVGGFGARAHCLLDSCIKGYEAEASYFDAAVRTAKLAVLQQQLLAALQPVYQSQVAAQQALVMDAFGRDLRAALSDSDARFAACAAACRAKALESFQTAFRTHLLVEGTGWTGEAEAEAMAAQLDAQVAKLKAERIAQASARVDKQLPQLVSAPVIGLLESCAPGMWPRLHAVCNRAAQSGEQALGQLLDGCELSAAEWSSLVGQLRDKVSAKLENHVREASLTRLSRMKDRFQEVFTLDENKTPRMWGPRDDIPAIAAQARQAAASVLGQLAVIRPPGVAPEGEAVESAVMRLARSEAAAAAGELDRASSGANGTPAGDDGAEAHDAVDVLSASEWPGVDEARVLLHPHEVRTTWREFVSSSNVLVQQAMATQQANRAASNKPPPLWAIAAMLFLGWNELMALIFNPIYLVLGVLGFLFMRSLYSELDVDRELGRGALPGALALGHKFMPACKRVVQKTQESIVAMMQQQPEAADRAAAYRVVDGDAAEVELQRQHTGGGNSTAPGARQRSAADRQPSDGFSEITPDAAPETKKGR